MDCANATDTRIPARGYASRTESERARPDLDAFAVHMDDISRCALDACGLRGLSVSIGTDGLVVSGRESVAALAALAAEIPPSLASVTALAPTATVEVAGSFSVDAAMGALVAELQRNHVIARVGHFKKYTEGPAWPPSLESEGFGWDSVAAALELRLARANAVLARLTRVMVDAACEIEREIARSPVARRRDTANAAASPGGGPNREKGARLESRRDAR